MGEYYAVQRSETYLAHYGVKGMRWGIRRALKARTKAQRSAKLQKQYLRASNRLAKLKKRENVELQKSDAQRYGKIAKRALGVAAGATGAALGGSAAKRAYLKKASDTWNRYSQMPGVKTNEFERILWGGAQQEAASSNPFVHTNVKYKFNKTPEYTGEAGKLFAKNQKALKGSNIGDYIKAGSATVAAGAGLTAAGFGAKAAMAKHRASPKGHAKAVADRQDWEKQMKSAFKGTKYASLPSTGPIKAGQARKRQKRLENLKQDTKDALVAGAMGALVGPYANIAVTSRRAAIGDGRSLMTGKKTKKKSRS